VREGLPRRLARRLASRWIAEPLRAIEASIGAFLRGEGPAKAEESLPLEGPRELRALIAEVGELMRRTRGEREELEEEIRDRTYELELRNAFLRSLSGSKDDASAYSKAIDELLKLIRADAMAIVYYDGSHVLRALVGSRGVLRSHSTLSFWETESLRRVAERSAKGGVLGAEEGLELFEKDLVYCLSVELKVQDELCGYIALGWSSNPPEGEKLELLRNVFANFGMHVKLRKQKARDEWVRGETEHALRKSEESLRTFFSETKDMIYTSNTDDVVASINDAGLELLGLSDRFEILGRPFAEHLLSPESRHFFYEKLQKKGFVTDYECVFRRKDGSTVFGLETAHAVRGVDGEIREVQGIVKDISERIAHERELWRANLKLAEANEQLKSTHLIMVQQEKLASIGQLAAGIAHEINNPLGFLKSNATTLSGFFETLRSAWDSVAEREPDLYAEVSRRFDLDYIFTETVAMLGESEEGFKRIIDIVKNLKSFARNEAEPVMEPYDLNEGIRSTLVVARNETKYVAEVELDLAEMPRIRALGGEINQVILNIVVNAAQAIESQKKADKGHILVSTRLEGERVVLRISDDGPGIAPEDRLKVFDPFFTTKEPGKGTGLGLSISYDIITRKHGGSLELSESPSGGALFTISLPVGGPPGSPRD
jgi:PAS domain S-box-containing protein